MALAGGLCLCLIDRVCCSRLKDRDMLSRCTAGAGVITGVEFALGILLNRVLGLRIWDYSEVPLNLLGQVCLPYSLLWLGLSLPDTSGKKPLTFPWEYDIINLASEMERCPSGLRS